MYTIPEMVDQLYLLYLAKNIQGLRKKTKNDCSPKPDHQGKHDAAMNSREQKRGHS